MGMVAAITRKGNECVDGYRGGRGITLTCFSLLISAEGDDDDELHELMMIDEMPGNAGE
jgi:hypothetical protein